MTAIVLREARENDAPAIHHLFNECALWLSEQGMQHWVGFHTWEWLTGALRELHTIVATSTAQVVGVAMMRPGSLHDLSNAKFYPTEESADQIQHHLWLQKLAVLPEYHRSGVASLLVEATEQHALSLELPIVRLDAVRRFEDLCRFYRHRGFQTIGERFDCYVWEKALARGSHAPHPN